MGSFGNLLMRWLLALRVKRIGLVGTVLFGKSDSWIIGFSRELQRMVTGIFRKSKKLSCLVTAKRLGYRWIFFVYVCRERLAASRLSVKTNKEVGVGEKDESLCRVISSSDAIAASSLEVEEVLGEK